MKVFDLFSGCGGFRLACEKVGFNIVAFCEIDKHAVKLYKNFLLQKMRFIIIMQLKLLQGSYPNLTCSLPDFLVKLSQLQASGKDLMTPEGLCF